MAAGHDTPNKGTPLAKLGPSARALCEWLAERDWDFRAAAAERGIEPGALYREWLEVLGWNQSLAARIYRRPGSDEPVSRQAIEAQMKKFGVVRPPDLKRELAGQGLEGGLDAMREVHAFVAEVSSPERLCCEQLLALARSWQQLRDHERARATLVEVIELARRIGAPEIVARAIHPMSYSTFQTTRFGSYNRDIIDQLEDWLPMLRSAGEPDALALALAHLGFELYVSPKPEEQARGAAASEEAHAIAEKSGSAGARVRVTCFRTLALSAPELLAERLALMERALDFADDLDVELRYAALHAALTDRVEAARFDEAERIVEQLRPLEASSGAPWPERYRASLATMRGEWDEAQRLCTLRPGVPLDSAAQVLALLQFEAMKQRGDWENLENLVRWNANREPAFIGYQIALGRVLCLMGRGDEVRKDFESWSQDRFSCVPRDLTYVPNLGLLADICHELDERAAAAVLYELLAPFRERMVVIRVLATVRGPVAHSLARLATTRGDFETANADFELACELAERAGSRPYLAWAQYDCARMLALEGAARSQGRRAELARRAAHAAREVGMSWLARRADELTHAVVD